jgi:hypothetical protein
MLARLPSIREERVDGRLQEAIGAAKPILYPFAGAAWHQGQQGLLPVCIAELEVLCLSNVYDCATVSPCNMSSDTSQINPVPQDTSSHTTQALPIPMEATGRRHSIPPGKVDARQHERHTQRACHHAIGEALLREV